MQRPLAHHRVVLSRRVIAYYGLIRDSESLPATYEFAAASAAPKEIGLRWESRGSPIYSAGLCSRAASLTPVSRRVQVTVASSSVVAFTFLLYAFRQFHAPLEIYRGLQTVLIVSVSSRDIAPVAAHTAAST